MREIVINRLVLNNIDLPRHYFGNLYVATEGDETKIREKLEAMTDEELVRLWGMTYANAFPGRY